MNFWDSIGQTWSSFSRSVIDQWKTQDAVPRTVPIDRSYGEGNDGKVVRLDVVLMAMHLFAARYAFGKLATSLRDQTRKLKAGAAEYAASKIISTSATLLATAGKRAAGTANTVLNFMDADLLELSKEVFIRREGWKARRDVYNLPLSQTKHYRRKTKLVSSRHHTPRQRRANSRWKSPR